MFNKLTLGLILVALWLNADAGADAGANLLARASGVAAGVDPGAGR